MDKHRLKNSISLRRLNNSLSVLVVLLSMYILVMPFSGTLSWWAQNNVAVLKPKPLPPVARSKQDIPNQDLLIIPSIRLDLPINQGPNASTLSKGLWIIPKTSTPDLGSNTVIAGHVVTYLGKGVFYDLNHVNPGDPITLYWQQKEYNYKVVSKTVVLPTDLSVEASSKKPMLTLYTCTLWTYTHRVIVQAELRSVVK